MVPEHEVINATDVYERQLNTQIQNNSLKQQMKVAKIKILRLSEAIKQRDALIQNYLKIDCQFDFHQLFSGNAAQLLQLSPRREPGYVN